MTSERRTAPCLLWRLARSMIPVIRAIIIVSEILDGCA